MEQEEKMKKIILLIVLVLMTSGCASMVKQTQVMKGMNREQVAAVWGNPQKIKNAQNSCCKMPDEEAWYYFSTSFQRPDQKKYVMFDGDAVKYVFVWKR